MTENQKIIQLQHLMDVGITFEETEQFATSIFAEEYTRATMIIEQIVMDNCESLHSTKPEIVCRKEMPNVVSFVGRRGTGKTSVMLSMLESLRNHGKKKPYDTGTRLAFNNREQMAKVSFFTLDYIDASSLEYSESVFILVLANMLTQLERERRRHDNATDGMRVSEDCYPYQQSGADQYTYDSLVKKLEELERHFLMLRQPELYQEQEYSAYENLRNVSSSQKVRAEFRRLVEDYLSYFMHGGCAGHAYLVIAIDDLDMAHYNNGDACTINKKIYDIMQTMSKFLSVPGVIVLTTYNHENLFQQDTGFFGASNKNYNELIKETKNNIVDNRGELVSRYLPLLESGKLASQYAEKVLPLPYRVYLFSWKKRDYDFSGRRISIDGNQRQEDIFTRFRQEGISDFKIKRFMLTLYAEMLGAYYDCEGTKQHFLEPDSLRALSEQVRLILGTGKDGRKQGSCAAGAEKRLIFKRVKDDAYFRFCQERLYIPAERELFDELSEERIDRRSERIVRLVSPKIDPLGKEHKKDIQFYEKEAKRMLHNHSRVGYDVVEIEDILQMIKKNSDVQYSYAELVHCIYHMTREKDFYSKELVACILHTYTLYLSELYQYYREKKLKISEQQYIKRYRYPAEEFLFTDEQERRLFADMEAAYRQLKGIVGKSVCGHWADYFFPELRLGTRTQVKNQVISCFENLSGGDFKLSCTIRNKQDVDVMITQCVFWMSFYSDLEQWGKIKVSWNPNGPGQQKGGKITLEHEGDYQFELTAFIKHAIVYPDYLYKMEQLLTEMLPKLTDDGIREMVLDSIRERFDDLWTKYYAWDKEFGNMMLPIQSLDLTYNLIKHLFKEGQEINNRGIVMDSYREFYSEFEKMTDFIRKHLQEIDKYYYLKEEQSFDRIFSESPFFKLLSEIQDDKYEDFNKRYIESLRVLFFNQLNLTQSPDEVFF